MCCCDERDRAPYRSVGALRLVDWQRDEEFVGLNRDCSSRLVGEHTFETAMVNLGGQMERKGTSTSNFGVGRRESHDSTGFYNRFARPDLSTDSHVPVPRSIREPFVCGDARQMTALADGEVALVVTSPPYFAGKQYEEELDRDGVPSSYAEYLELLAAVFEECKRVLEPGGRIAVNVANLGRKPYRSLASDVIEILQGLGLLLRGEVIWQKGEGASGSCAWGSYRSPANPVLRDLTERVIIASKGRFDRALPSRVREQEGRPFESTLTADEFMAATLDVWQIPPENATRVNHPAPFPTALPERLIQLYTYRNDLVVDPFMGSGSTLVAASRLDRRYVGYDLDESYVSIARRRVDDEGKPKLQVPPRQSPVTIDLTLPPSVTGEAEDFQSRAFREGRAAQEVAKQVLEHANFTISHRNSKIPRTGVVMNFIADDALENSWYFDVSGAFTTTRGGLLRTDTVWKTLGRANVLARKLQNHRLVFLTSHLPKPGSEGDVALRAAGPGAFFDVIEMLSAKDMERLTAYATGQFDQPLEGFWRDRDL